MPVPRIALPRDATRLGPELGPSLSQVIRISSPRPYSTHSPRAVAKASDTENGSGTQFGRRRPRRFPKYLHDSPTGTLALRLKSRTEPLTFDTWKRFDHAARSRSLRLPIMALQMMIRQDETRQHTSLSESLCDDQQWRSRLSSLAFKGISEGDITHWTWILAGKDGDERIERFVSVDRPKPIFVLFLLLRRDETFHKSSSLAALYNYINRHHIRSKVTPPDAALPFGAVRRTLDAGLNMAPQTFATLLRLLVCHYLRVWPMALPAVAKLVSSYVETMQLVGKNRPETYANLCAIFNHALVLFQRKSPVNPMSMMRYNWRAQKILLAMSTTMPRPLLINRAGFRAIRRVMLALGKSPGERRVALRMARTWPPYRRDWDGMDEKRQPEDDFSRSVRAGMLMREAGYADMEHDRALSVLGGVLPDDWPTVQTRSLSPRTWTGRRANLNIFSTWAARVKATRDINEAWHEFQVAPTEGIEPNVQVYAEMFKKLVAAPVNELPGAAKVLPGDGREVFPVNDATLSAFEKQRLRPPSVEALYTQMLHSGTRPVGDCLAVLVQHAPSMQAAMRYLHDGPFDRAVVAALNLPYLPMNPSAISRRPPLHAAPELTLDLLQQIPLEVLSAYVFLMCRFQPRLTLQPARLGKMRRTGLIHHAIHLCAQRLPLSLKDGQTYRAPWHTILRTLAEPKVLVSAERTQDRRFHDEEALVLALKVFERVRIAGGIDIVMLESLCKNARKCLRWVDLGKTSDAVGGDRIETIRGAAEADSRLSSVMQTAHDTLTAAFREMVLDSPAPSATDPHPAIAHDITASTLYGYLQLLGYLGDTDGMVAAMRWALQMWDDDTVLEDAKDLDHAQHATMGHVFIMFRAFAETQVAPEVLAELERQLHDLKAHKDCSWRWPTAKDADEYVRWRRQEYNTAFWSQVRPGV